MRRLLTVGILSIFCSSLGACAPERLAVSLRPDLDNPSRLICEAAPASRPERGPPHEIDWSKVLTVAEAKIQHGLYVWRSREGFSPAPITRNGGGTIGRAFRRPQSNRRSS
jgi:hypothetical protein